jgi:hypothetical protein
MSDSEQPTGEGIPPSDRFGLGCQYHESRLQCVLGVVVVAENVVAEIEDHWPVPTHQHLER